MYEVRGSTGTITRNHINERGPEKIRKHIPEHDVFKSEYNFSLHVEPGKNHSYNNQTALEQRDISVPDRVNSNVDWRWKPNAVMYGFLHMAKSGGTEVNGQLAMHYERICGNKGSSYDFYQANDRHKKLGARNTYYDAQDIISKADVKANISPPHNRGAVTLKILNEIGYEDCDYVALEEHAHTW
eukprot:CAMPEP_0194318496 /NCGR_PEP_ID=MMETSP0171-20130528/15088_1 /TAXON_ID=218684 /ORGANISM="Corethron pennatum, Strain L29A3" /LENGTH=184 /DNA_ID=CAMNT_0039075417 /DNA_START=120 /DNA_END=671 /DNA_ORIENTATION=+